MKKTRQKAILSLKIISVLLLLGLVLLFAFRNTILDKVIHRIDAKLERDYQCNFTIQKAEFHDLTNLEFHDISLVPHQKDTLVSIGELKTSVSFWKLLVGDIQLGKLEINKGFIQLVKTKNGSNFDAFLHSKKEKDEKAEVNYAKLLNRISSKLMDLVPTDMQVKGFAFRIDDKGNKVVFDFNELALANKKLTTIIQVTSDKFSQQWSINGFADPRDRKADLTFANAKNDTIIIPYIDKKFNLKSGFKSIHFNLENLAMNSGELHIEGYSSIQDLVVNNPKIANKDVIIKSARFDYHWIVGERFMALDSTSTVQLNNIKCQPYISYTNEKDKVYALKLKIPKMKAQDFISSLPKGLFRHFEGMEAQGNFSYALNFEYNNHKPKDVIFTSKLKPDGIKITKYGEADLNKINGNFVYRAVDKGVLQRPINVGPGNGNYTPLSLMSPYLKKCVLTSEDPSFMTHRGFINEAFRESITKNIRTKKFSRGASTISMQLVKNVFLTREKTLSRKLEEILLVYILENNRISSKDRMLEVYFNIIEWGPNVYGIAEASEFYFQKRPWDLNVNQCLFLATIIPNPKGFMAKFDANNKLKPAAKQTEKFLTNLMFKRNILMANDTIGNFPLEISGRAKFFLKQKPTSIDSDKTPVEEFEF
ncbi:transglycosylase domain-containing protein [Flavobacterium sangjuense]|uniref:Monofunctional biosynthetic peptidoglycan transglycosylase n=1 Tax=Flavobacterium sangjuense TaxID=2518177 RepID=A0A4P7PR22_9FLAO|nr:transglycosylase domain-containing protein [Flavobacterium sangjuense]QBZ97298.1 Monofunctional biosynthetic peptidoglycan transglycosylase [Flavobacterium sangjuense]